MRFIDNGPSIPDDLLIARDEGRVVFFCGAGVSRAKAGLPDFFGLAQKVVDILGVQPASGAITLLEEARAVEERTGLTGLISTDRIFGILEREFLVQDVEAAVATALQPHDTPDLSAHETLVDLATAPGGDVRIVTTNLDRLFDDCRPHVRSWQPPQLPDPWRTSQMSGIVYLHGKAAATYRVAEGEGFVLSSASFGRAYLTEAWATAFFQQVVANYVVLFVGYAADDPPIQYLLEALNDPNARRQDMYAFQSGDATRAVSKWSHRGVQPIPYGDRDALWPTLSAWAVRARDPNVWQAAIVSKARSGPERLAPHERGQVAHVASTSDGLRRFSDAHSPPPAEWLCVFDPRIRYGQPGRSGTWRTPGPRVDPFHSYCLDSDLPPDGTASENDRAQRAMPFGAWDAFSLNRRDRSDMTAGEYSGFRDDLELSETRLPTRLLYMGAWLARVAEQPTALWWAARQAALHPHICRQIRRELFRPQGEVGGASREAWLYLFDHWRQSNLDGDALERELEVQIMANGWTRETARRYVAASMPTMKVRPGLWWCGPKPPQLDGEAPVERLLWLEVVYAQPSIAGPEMPTEYVADVVAEMRRNLEAALALETERGGWELLHMAPISSRDGLPVEPRGAKDGLSGLLHGFAREFARLCECDAESARREYDRWRSAEDRIFTRLRIWALRILEVIPHAAFEDALAGLSDDAFWDVGHQPDLLRALGARWSELDKDARIRIERRILAGRPPDESTGECSTRRATQILNRLTWLSGQGCSLEVAREDTIAELRRAAPGWESERTEEAMNPVEGEAGFVTTRTDPSELLATPLAKILSKAEELSSREERFLVECDPYRGLAVAWPVRALSALVVAGKRGEFPVWAWNTFLTAEERKGDRARLMGAIARRVVGCPRSARADFCHGATTWLRNVGGVLAGRDVGAFRSVVESLIETMVAGPVGGVVNIERRAQRDWGGEAINSSVGHVVEAMFSDPAVVERGGGDGLPCWLSAGLEKMLKVEGDAYRYVVVILASRLSRLYWWDTDWTEAHLLTVLESEDAENRAAFWNGFLWAGQAPWSLLYMRLKESVLRVARDGSGRGERHGEVLAGLVLTGWRNRADGRIYVSNEEFRGLLVDVEEGFRGRVLWLVEKWVRDARGEDPSGAAALVVEFLADVWPRQRSVKTPAMSARLFRLAFANRALFPQLANVIEPLLTKAEVDRVPLPRLEVLLDMVDGYPREVLGLVDAVLPARVEAWPLEVGEIVGRIWEADEELRLDRRLRELKWKWDTRWGR